MNSVEKIFVVIFNIFTIFLVIPIAAILSYLVGLWRLVVYRWRVSDLAKKHVLITGCGSGFGLLLALKLAKMGLTVHAGCHRQESVKMLREKQRNRDYSKLHPFLVDITSQESVDKAYEHIAQSVPHSEGLWALVNNAGANMHSSPDEWLTVDHYRELLEINCLGQIRMTHKFKPLLIRSKGRLIFMTSLFSDILYCYLGPYSIAKHAINAYAKLLNLELSGKVTVISVTPGLSPTALSSYPIVEQSFLREWAKLPAKTRESYSSKFLEKRLAYVKTCIETFNVGNELDLTVNACVHAVTGKFPKPRYWLGYDGTISRLMSACDDDVTQWLSDVLRLTQYDSFEYPLEIT